MNIDEIVRTLNMISEEVERIKTQNVSDNSDFQVHEKMYSIASKYPIKSHILQKCDESIQIDYISSLIHLFDSNEDDELFWQRRLLIYRIIASIENKFDVEQYITKSMKVDLKFWDDFVQETDEIVKSNYIVDLLLLVNFDSKNSKRGKFEHIVDLVQFFQISRDDICHLASISKTIMEQNFNCFIELIEPNNSINYSSFLGYFDNIEFSTVVTNLEELWRAKGDVLLANAVISNERDYLDLSMSLAETICFKKCTFSFIRGIKSEMQGHIIFDECVFDSNLFNSSQMNTIFGGSYSEYEKDYIFISGKNLKFINTNFLNCKASKHLIKATESIIENCNLKNCEGVDMPCTYLLDLKDTIVENVTFSDCVMETNKEDRKSTYGGIILLERGKISNCIFEKCGARGNSGYGSYANYAMQIACIIHTKIMNCKFDECRCSSCDSGNKTVTSYIVGLRNSKEENNEFSGCSSYHYRYSDIGSSCNVGNI